MFDAPDCPDCGSVYLSSRVRTHGNPRAESGGAETYYRCFRCFSKFSEDEVAPSRTGK